ncbi:arylesterase [Rhodobacteraceae bacterium LMO-12]|nr:arylesterase [Rhodobacteraceae bacterium LMO-JJ12]
MIKISRTYGVKRMMRKTLAVVFFACLLVGQTAAEAREKVQLVALGDSLTAGYGLREEEGFVPVLRAWMAAQGEDVEIINAGVSGDTTSGGLERFDWALSDETQGIIIELGANDMLRGVDPGVARENLRKMVEMAQARGLEVLLVGMPVAGNYGSEYKMAFETIWPDLAREFDVALYSDFFAGLGEGQVEVLRFMQDDGIHPNAEGVRRIVSGIGPEVRALVARIRAQ